MVHSMTGYGRANVASPNYDITVELKSLNNKYLELNLKLPRMYMRYEHTLRAELMKKLLRGKVSLFLDVVVLNPKKRSLNLNRALAQSYFDELDQLRTHLGLKDSPDLDLLLNLPDIVPVEAGEPDPEEWELIQKAIHQAADRMIQSRKDEGAALARDLERRVAHISSSLEAVKDLAPERIERIRNRIQKAIEELRDRIEYDPNRFEQELVFYIEKLDLNEEMVRLEQHLTYFAEVLYASEDTGKKLNFIAQEMGREINTIGSKAQHAGIQRHVVSMKDELDKIKEQIMNVV